MLPNDPNTNAGILRITLKQRFYGLQFWREPLNNCKVKEVSHIYALVLITRFRAQTHSKHMLCTSWSWDEHQTWKIRLASAGLGPLWPLYRRFATLYALPDGHPSIRRLPVSRFRWEHHFWDESFGFNALETRASVGLLAKQAQAWAYTWASLCSYCDGIFCCFIVMWVHDCIASCYRARFERNQIPSEYFLWSSELAQV